MKSLGQRLGQTKLQIKRQRLWGAPVKVDVANISEQDGKLVQKERGFLSFGQDRFVATTPDGQSTPVESFSQLENAISYAEKPPEELKALEILDSAGYTFDAPDKKWKGKDEHWTSLDAYVHDWGHFAIREPGAERDMELRSPSLVKVLASRIEGELPAKDRVDELASFERETGLSIAYNGRSYKGLGEQEKRAARILDGETFSFQFGKDRWGEFDTQANPTEAWEQTQARAERYRKFDPIDKPTDSTTEYMARRAEHHSPLTASDLKGYDALAESLEKTTDLESQPIRTHLEKIAKKGFAHQVAESHWREFDMNGELKPSCDLNKEQLVEFSALFQVSEMMSLML